MVEDPAMRRIGVRNERRDVQQLTLGPRSQRGTNPIGRPNLVTQDHTRKHVGHDRHNARPDAWASRVPTIASYAPPMVKSAVTARRERRGTQNRRGRRSHRSRCRLAS
jgi:hypothetical protein